MELDLDDSEVRIGEIARTVDVNYYLYSKSLSTGGCSDLVGFELLRMLWRWRSKTSFIFGCNVQASMWHIKTESAENACGLINLQRITPTQSWDDNKNRLILSCMLRDVG